MRLYIFHRTQYLYPGPVSQSYNELRLPPLSNDWQKCLSSTLSVLPIVRPQSYLDLNGNIVHYFELAEKHQKLIIESRSVGSSGSPGDSIPQVPIPSLSL